MDAVDHATRTAYDAVADDYARLVPDLSAEAPLDRAVLTAFRDLLGERSADAPVAEVGCGSGRITAHLAAQGVRMLGLDLSPGMAAVARRSHPGLPLVVGHAAALPIRSAALSGVVSWYSVIHLPPGRLAAVCREFARVTRSGAPVVLAFQSGDGERVDRTTSYGLDVPLTYYRHRVAGVQEALVAAGLALHATVQREPSLAHETTSQALLLALRP